MKNNKLKSIFQSKKTKIIIIAVCAALLVSAGTITALAAAGESFPAFPFLNSSGKIGSLSVRGDENGMSFSTDGGETWTDTLPENVSYTEEICENGESFKVTVSVDADEWDAAFFKDYHADMPTSTLGKDGFEYLHMMRVENDTVYHSLDDGETWIEGFPESMIREGAEEIDFFFEDESGFVSFRHTVTIDE